MRTTVMSTLRPRRRALSDEVLGNLLAAVGNHEVKAILFSLMRPGHSYSGGELHDALRAAQTDPPVWVPKSTVAAGYCRETLEPLGVVVPATFGGDLVTTGYAVTPLGEELGKPLAGALLRFSETHACSLIDLFGTTAAAGGTLRESAAPDVLPYRQRAPIARLRIFRTLVATDQPLRETDLVQPVQTDHVGVGRHLKRLAKHGIVEFESAVPASFVRYRRHPHPPAVPPLQYRHETALTRDVLNAVRHLEAAEPFTRDEVLGALGGATEGRKSRTGTVTCILRKLATDGYLISEGFQAERRSRVRLADERRDMISELVELMEGFQRLDRAALRDGRRHGQQILDDSRRVSRLVQIARDARGLSTHREPRVRERGLPERAV